MIRALLPPVQRHRLACSAPAKPLNAATVRNVTEMYTESKGTWNLKQCSSLRELNWISRCAIDLGHIARPGAVTPPPPHLGHSAHFLHQSLPKKDSVFSLILYSLTNREQPWDHIWSSQVPPLETKSKFFWLFFSHPLSGLSNNFVRIVGAW